MKHLSGLQKILKRHGRMIVGKVPWVWDYVREEPVREEELKLDQARFAANELAKIKFLKKS